MSDSTKEAADLIGKMGFDRDLAENLLEIVKLSVKAGRDQAIKECAEAARTAFENAMNDYVLIGPGGMASRMISEILALEDQP